MASLSQRCRFVATVLEQLGAPYLWNAKGNLVPDGPGKQVRVFDCSGLVTWAWKMVGGEDWRATHNTDVLWAKLKPTTALRAGTLVLYGVKGQNGRRDDPNHVMVLMGEGVVVGASGGGHLTTTLALARGAGGGGARVKALPHYTYRPDCLGFRDLPFTD